jgi:hypothetical protein
MDPPVEGYIGPSDLCELDAYVKINTNHEIIKNPNEWLVVIQILHHQQDMGHNYLPYKFLGECSDMKKLMDLAKIRHTKVAKSNFDDSIKNASMRFQIIEKIPQIEEGM